MRAALRSVLVDLLVVALIAGLVGCAAPRGPWIVEGAAWDVQRWADVTAEVSGDRKGHLARGGTVRVVTGDYALDVICKVDPGKHASGCITDAVYVLVMPEIGLGPGPETTALAHEFCHMGLEYGGGYSGPVIYPTEDQADACALLVAAALQ